MTRLQYCVVAISIHAITLCSWANRPWLDDPPANTNTAPIVQSNDPQVETLVRRAMDASIGKKEIQFLRIEGVVSSPQGITHIQMLAQGDGPDKFRVTQSLPGGQSMECGTDGELAWLRSPIDGSWRLLDRRGVLISSVGVLPHKMIGAIFERFPIRSLGPMEKMDGASCQRIDMRDHEGLEASAWIDQYSGKLRVLRTSEPPSRVPTVMTIEAWTKVGELELPRRISIRRGDSLTTSDFTTISGEPIDASLFAPPPEVILLSKGNDPHAKNRTSSRDEPLIKP